MIKSLALGVLFLLISILSPKLVWALEDITLLPKGVRALMFRQGYMSEIGNKYSSNYQLGSIQYRTSRRIDAKMIKGLNPEFNELVDLVNKEFPGYDLGSKVYLGDLIIEGEPAVDYSAPVFAYGITDRYMMAIAVPIVRYNVNIRARHEGAHNIEQFRNSLPGSYDDFSGNQQVFSERLEEAYNQLRDASNLSRKLSEICASKNLRCLGKYSQDTIGDIQWIHRYLLHKGVHWSLMLRAHLNLPTGPEDDPNNMIDLPLFHRTYLDTALVTQYKIGKWSFHNSFGMVLQKEDRVKKRVPTSENDILPDEDQTEDLRRKVGDTLKYEFNLGYSFREKYAFAIGMQKEWKYRDQYNGSFPDRDYDLLARDSGAELLKLSLATSYNTIQDFLKKRFPIPLSLSYSYSDIVSGKNIERQNLHELSLAVMF